MYFDAEIRVDHYHARHSFTRKFCGCMSLRGGCAIVCALWAGIHLYVAIMAFQMTSPVFSYLNQIAFIVLGAICVAFVAVAFYNLFSLFVESPLLLRIAHRITWITVVMFLVCYFIDIILFGIEKQQFRDWCISSANSQENDTDDIVIAQVYNCDKLWEDELKLSITIFIICSVCYLYWATCLWSYAQKIFTVGREAERALARGPPLPMGPPVPPPPPGTIHHPPVPGLMNLKPKIMVLDDGSTKYDISPPPSLTDPPAVHESDIEKHQQQYYEDDGQKSAAQIARILFKKLKNAYAHNKRT